MTPSPSSGSGVDIPGISVVQACARKGHALTSDCPLDPDDALCQTVLPLLRLQHSRRNRGGWSVFPSLSLQYHRPHVICQELAPFTLLTPLGHMSARPAELPVLLSPSFSPSSITRQVSSLPFHFQFHLLLTFPFLSPACLTELYPKFNHLMEFLTKMLTWHIPSTDIL